MKLEDILYEAILVAEKNGYKGYLNYLPLFVKLIKNPNYLCKRIFYMHRNNIMFSQDFAKAFFGNEDSLYQKKAWVYHLQQMSYEDKPIIYLAKMLKYKKGE